MKFAAFNWNGFKSIGRVLETEKVVERFELPIENYENDALYRLEIRKKLREIHNIGFHDAFRYLYPKKQEYTFWDYTSGAWQKNNGMRIDHFLISNSIINSIKDVKINKYPRSKEKPSDHTPIEIELT